MEHHVPSTTSAASLTACSYKPTRLQRFDLKKFFSTVHWFFERFLAGIGGLERRRQRRSALTPQCASQVLTHVHTYSTGGRASECFLLLLLLMLWLLLLLLLLLRCVCVC